MTESVAASLFNTIYGNNGLNITGLYKDSFLKKDLHYDSICWLNPHICDSVVLNGETPLNFYVMLSKVSDIKFTEDHISINGTIRFVFENMTDLIGDYELEDFHMKLNVFSRPEYA